MKPLKVKDTKSIRNFVAAVRGFILRMVDVGASDEAKSKYVFADILAKLMAEDQRAYGKMKVKGKWEVVIQSKRCKKCLKTGHRHQQCSRKACDINSCRKSHNYQLHKDPKPNDKCNLKHNVYVTSFKPHGLEANKEVLFQLIVQELQMYQSKRLKCTALMDMLLKDLPWSIDSGSNQSLIRKEFADKLGLVGETKKMKMYATGGGIRIETEQNGDKLAPDLAINVINLFADSDQVKFPEAARILKDHTYVDDIAGLKTIPEKAKEVIHGIDAIFRNFTIKQVYR
ncbi:Hypothetical predicted protein [Paramuricea clavata]|uniref:Uncharacterized protein n=1 Tax=Paramuricea clavata TaxID=317549 RepID=A0A7D9ISB1_PARCT|nr:Hypothetical predicted protein [Paramuricea clavata]